MMHLSTPYLFNVIMCTSRTGFTCHRSPPHVVELKSREIRQASEIFGWYGGVPGSMIHEPWMELGSQITRVGGREHRRIFLNHFGKLRSTICSKSTEGPQAFVHRGKSKFISDC